MGCFETWQPVAMGLLALDCRAGYLPNTTAAVDTKTILVHGNGSFWNFWLRKVMTAVTRT